MFVQKIKMKPGCGSSQNVQEIDSLFVGSPFQEYWKKEDMYDFLQKLPGSIQVQIPPYPDVLPSVSRRGEKYVKSQPNDYLYDNLLRLPRE